jgi:hypothetical protein
MTVTLRSKLPVGDGDGLQKAASRLRTKRHRDDEMVIAARVVLHRVIEKMHDPNDPIQYELAVVAIEIIDEEGDRSFLDSVIHSAYERRTGKQPLPFPAIETTTSDDS